MIAAAERYIYFENQFFASRVVAEAVAKRLGEPNGPEFVIVNPKVVEGWVEEEVMTPARAELLMLLREADRYGRLRVYTPVTRDGCDIYVHSKIGIVDDRLLRVGSANLNNRSMGLDSECDLLLDAARPANAGAGEQISARLHDLVGEHLGVAPDKVAQVITSSGSLIAAIEGLRSPGRSLVPLEVEQPNALEAAVAKTESMDPERAGTYFDTKHSPNLLTRLRRRLPHRRRDAH
jgi:phospholipase D1/2